MDDKPRETDIEEPLNIKRYGPSRAALVSIIVFQQFLSALSYPVAKFGLREIEPFTFAFFRFALSATVLLAWVFLRGGGPAVEKRDYWKIGLMGVLIIPFNQTLFLYGQKLTSAGHGAFLFATTPIWIFIGAVLFLKESFIWRRALGVLLGLGGVFWMIRGGSSRFGWDYLLGDLAILGSVAAGAACTLFGKNLVIKYGALRVIAYSITFGTLMFFPFGLQRALRFDYSQATIGAWAAVAYMALGLSVASYVLWYWALKHIDATRLAVFQNIQPIIATSVAALLLGEQLTSSLFIGGLLVLTGVLITEL